MAAPKPIRPLTQDELERFWSKVAKVASPNGCWLWLGTLDTQGYGKFHRTKRLEGIPRNISAHRASYTTLVGPIPDGLEVDHLCRTRDCVRPDHLEAVPGLVNNRRANNWAGVNYRKTHCIHGHKYTPENTMHRTGGRRCRACSVADCRARRAARKGQVAA